MYPNCHSCHVKASNVHTHTHRHTLCVFNNIIKKERSLLIAARALDFCLHADGFLYFGIISPLIDHSDYFCNYWRISAPNKRNGKKRKQKNINKLRKKNEEEMNE